VNETTNGKRSKHEEGRRGNGNRAMKVEIRYFEGCPNHAPALEMVRRVLNREKIEAEVRLIEVTDEKVVETVRFLGSPSVRVDRIAGSTRPPENLLPARVRRVLLPGPGLCRTILFPDP
jgi:hypothetical protein